jgi:O-antigen ligase
LIAPFELAKGWHLYSVVADSFGAAAGYLERAGMQRAFASAFGSISLGFVIMVAIGCALGILHTVRSSNLKPILLLIFAVGLMATLSRGPWVGVGILLLIYLATGRGAVANLGKLGAIGVIGLTLYFGMTGGAGLSDLLPLGSVETENIAYRQDLLKKGIAVVQRDPWFGNVDYRKTPEMLAMKQGEGIIDIVNTYLEIAMKYGLIGLSLFVGIFATILSGLRRMLKFHAAKDSNLHDYVRASMATLVAIMVTICTVSAVDYIPYVYWSFAGLCVALIRVGYKERSLAASAVSANRVPA